MLTNAYFATLKDYRLDVENGKFPATKKYGNHAKALYYTTFDVKEEAYIAFQCQLSDGTIADCMLFGCDKSGQPAVACIMMGDGPHSCPDLSAFDGVKTCGFIYSYNHFSGGAKPEEGQNGSFPKYYVDHQSTLSSELEDMFNGGCGKEVFSKFE